MSTQHHPALAHQFDDLGQQYESSTLGMWSFLATEVMLFGGLFTAYIVYRINYPEAFAAATRQLAIPHELPFFLQSIFLGTVNTAVLLCSSLSVALAVHAAQEGKNRRVMWMLVLTLILGATFLGIKGLEYYIKYEEHLIPGLNFRYEGVDPEKVELFFLLYFVSTGLHALHMVIGMGVITVIALMARRGRFSAEYYTPVEITGLYWHFVDVVWVFLFPLFYLIGLHE